MSYRDQRLIEACVGKLSQLCRALLLSLVATTSAWAIDATGISLHRAAPDQTPPILVSPIHVPELLRPAYQYAPPDETDFRAKLVRGRSSREEVFRFHKAIAELPAFGGKTDAISALYVTDGVVDLRTLAQTAAGARGISCKGDTCTLTMPLLVGANAHLIIADTDLTMLAERGAMISSSGELTILRSTLRGPFIDPDSDHDHTQFRPFVTGLAGSNTRLLRSQFYDLGYHETRTYGISIAADKGDPAPTATVIGNLFQGLYYGFYSHFATRIPIIGNTYRNNIIYGIDPHDYTDQLWIIANTAYGTQKRHGIVVSRGVARSVFAHNLSYRNAGTGLMLDRHSTQNLVMFNHLRHNKADGIAVFESSQNRVIGNVVRNNAKAGIRVRNARDVTLAANAIQDNRGPGIILYSGTPNGYIRRAEDAYVEEVRARLAMNHARRNGGDDLAIKGCVSRVILQQEVAHQPGFDSMAISVRAPHGWEEALWDARLIPAENVELRAPCP